MACHACCCASRVPKATRKGATRTEVVKEPEAVFRKWINVTLDCVRIWEGKSKREREREREKEEEEGKEDQKKAKKKRRKREREKRRKKKEERRKKKATLSISKSHALNYAMKTQRNYASKLCKWMQMQDRVEVRERPKIAATGYEREGEGSNKQWCVLLTSLSEGS